mmetsp:Transcript_8607/g.7704  ORF Transcript_8607/g.7704 Transcript_8607/m.7704 type:complete len:369 (+) Transcript_8607:53-1159(+)
MPPKAQVFKSPDGKEFTTKKEWRDYMMTTFYSYKNKENEIEPLIKKPGDIDGQMFDISDCNNVTIILMDYCEQVQIDQVHNSKIFIGACVSSIFIRNCENCIFYSCCRQLRLREVTKSKLFIYSMSEVHIEYSNQLQFGCFNGSYPEQLQHLSLANLDITNNLWYDIFDHNDPSKSNANWSIIPETEYEEPWYPQGLKCDHAIPLTKPGSVERIVEDSSMKSFDFQQLVRDSALLASSPSTPVAVPAKTIPDTVFTEKNIIKNLINKYGNYKAGDNLDDVVSSSFVNILQNGDALPYDLMSASIVGGNIATIDNITISHSKDLAWSSFSIASLLEGYIRCTGILEKNESNDWRLSYVQRSDISPAIEE